MDPAIDKAAGDVLLRYVDFEGRPIDWAGQSRLLAISLDQLKRTPMVIGVAAAAAKAPGIIGVARSGVIDALVTDSATGTAILELLT